MNLPAVEKMARPGYQRIVAGDIPSVDLPRGSGVARIIAGELNDVRGPARTFTPINLWDVRLEAGKNALISIPDRHTAMVVCVGGRTITGMQTIDEAEMVVLSRGGDDVEVRADSAATFLVLSGAPIDEPVVAYGPFVMNSSGDSPGDRRFQQWQLLAPDP